MSVLFSNISSPSSNGGPPTTYTVSYDANANQHETGETSGETPTVTTHSAGTVVTVAANSGNLARQGFTFAGWNTASNGSGTTYTAGSGTFTINADTILYAKWEIPSSARLLANSSETSSVVNITNPNVVTNGNSCISGVRGITSDGTYVYLRPSGALGYICKLNMDGVVVSVLNIGAGLSSLSEGSLSLTYSKGCLFIQPTPNSDSPPDYVGNSSINCIDLSDSSITSISLPPSRPLFPGVFWLKGNLIDFPDGRIGAVSRPYTPAEFLASGADTSTITSCPLSYCKILRLYTLSGTGKNVVPTWSEDMVIAENQDWPNDDHGIATDGTYLYQSRFAEGYRVYALRTGKISYRVFNGSGSGSCGASSGVSGGLCEINYPVTGSNDSGKVLGNNTYWGRNHSTNRYLNGDYNEGRFWVSGSVAPPAGPGSSSQSITYDTNGGSGSISATTGNTNASVSLSNGSGFSRTGYTLSRWDTSTTGVGTSYTLGQSGVTMPSGGLSLYAVWSANSLVVTFDSQGGTSISSGSTATGSTVATSPGSPTRQYFSFLGWFASASGGTAITFPYTHGQTSNFTLYAQWSDTRRTQSISLSGENLDKGSSTTLNATGYSGTGAISYSLQSGDCTLRGAVLTANSGTGSCQVSASIDADATYQSASTSASFTQRTRLAQNITFPSASPMRVDSSTQILNATASSSLSVTLRSATPTICTIASGAVIPLTRGNCTIVASQEGNSTYLPASDLSQSFVIQGLPQAITFAQPTAMSTVDDDQEISALSSSGLIVALKATSTSVCSISAGMIIPLAEGVCIISAEQSGNTRYEPALSVTRSVTITYRAKSPQVIILEPLLAMRVSDPTQTIQYSSNTSTPISINVSPSEVCSLLPGNKIKAVGAGTCMVQVSQVATRRYLAGLSSKSFQVVRDGEVRSKIAVQLSWARPFSISQGTALSSAQLNATANVPGTFAYFPVAGTILPRGIHDLTVTFTPEDRTRYLPVKTSVRILVSTPIPAATSAPALSPTPTPTKNIQPSIPAATVLFKSGSAIVDSRGMQVLKDQVSILRTAGIFEINIAGYTDSLPGQDNMLLSKRRAEAVSEIMLKLEPRLKIRLEFLGESSPVASNRTKQGQALNRRVVVTVVNNS